MGVGRDDEVTFIQARCGPTPARNGGHTLFSSERPDLNPKAEGRSLEESRL